MVSQMVHVEEIQVPVELGRAFSYQIKKELILNSQRPKTIHAFGELVAIKVAFDSIRIEIGKRPVKKSCCFQFTVGSENISSRLGE